MINMPIVTDLQEEVKKKTKSENKSKKNYQIRITDRIQQYVQKR